MKFSTVAFSESQDNAAAYANVAAVIDRNHKVDGDFLYISKFTNLFGAMACMGSTVPGQVYLRSPSLRQHNNYYITPVEHDIHPGAKVHMMMRPEQPFKLTPDEGLEALSNANPAAAEQHAVIVWLSDGMPEKVSGRIITIAATVTLAQVVNSWEYSDITLVSELPVGTYSLVGLRVEADGGIAARLIPKAGFHTPGVPCVLNGEEDGAEIFRNGNLGKWFDVDSNQLPGLELLGSAAVASATYNIYMDFLV